MSRISALSWTRSMRPGNRTWLRYCTSLGQLLGGELVAGVGLGAQQLYGGVAVALPGQQDRQHRGGAVVSGGGLSAQPIKVALLG